MPRHSKERAPWRHVKYHRKRAVRTDQQSLHIIRHFRTKSSTFVWIITFRKTASRSFRYLSLSLQNGVLRNQGDTGVRALPTIKPGPITVRMVLIMTRLLYPAALSQRQQIPVCTLHKMSRKWTEHKFIQVSATVTGLTGPDVFIPCSDGMWSQIHFNRITQLPFKYVADRGPFYALQGQKYVDRSVLWL